MLSTAATNCECAIERPLPLAGARSEGKSKKVCLALAGRPGAKAKKKRARPLERALERSGDQLRLHFVWPCRGPIPPADRSLGTGAANSVLATRSSLRRLRSTQAA